MSLVAASDTLRAVIDAGKSSKRLDELSSARVIGKIAMLAHAAQQKAGAGKSIGPITPSRVTLSASGEASLDAAASGSTMMYSSPEVVGGGSGDRRSDVFSLGTVMWEALTHQRLFDAMNDAAVKVAVQEREIQPPSEMNANIPAELSAICMRALSRNPADRYQSLKAMAVEIEEFLEEAGYADDDSKIAQFLAGMTRKPASSSVAPPVEKPTTLPLPKPVAPATAKPAGLPSMPRPGASTPPANAPAQPSILTSEPAKPSNSGAALAAALANAGSSSGLPSISPSATAIGVPAAPLASEWQDKTPKPHAAAPVAAAASEAVSATPNAVSAPIPLVPMPPILPSGSTSGARADKSTVLGIAPMAPKTNGDSGKVEAKHVEAKPAALIVEDKPKAVIVDDPVEAKANAALADEEGKQSGEVAAVKEDTRATLVDTTSPALVNAAADAKVAAGKEAPKLETPTAIDGAHAAAKKSDPDDNATKPEAAVAAKVESDMKATTKVEAKTEAKPDEKRAKKDTKDTKRDKKETGPHPASVVSLPGRDSKADVLAGWGWGTGKHDAIAPSGYSPDDDEEYEQPNSKKTLTYVIGGGVALALLIVVIAFAAGGSKDKKNSAKEKEKEAAIAKAKREDQAALAEAAKRDTPAPVEATAPVDEAAAAKTVADQKAADDKAAADQAAAAKLAEEQAKQDAEARAKAAAAQATADAEAAAAKVKADAELAKKSEAERKKLEAEAAKAAEAQRKADAKKAAEDAKAADAAKKAEAKRLAQEEAARKKEEAAAARQAKADAAKAAKEEAARKKAEAAKTASNTTRPKTTKTEPKTVAVTETKKTEPKSDVNPETAYRQGLQAFARGDTTSALASLRSSLAANPNYAPTWRGLGLVFEKMGEKDQAKAAYKRYLQLSPSAGDAEIIKGRLERLGS